MFVKRWHFPSFDEWYANNRKYSETMGEFTCVCEPTCWSIHGGDTRYEVAIAAHEIPTNIYVKTVVHQSFHHIYTDEDYNLNQLRHMYQCAVANASAQWIRYIQETYLEDEYDEEYLDTKVILLHMLDVKVRNKGWDTFVTYDEVIQLFKYIYGRVTYRPWEISTVRLFTEIDEGMIENAVMEAYPLFERNWKRKTITVAPDKREEFTQELKKLPINFMLECMIENFYEEEYKEVESNDND